MAEPAAALINDEATKKMMRRIRQEERPPEPATGNALIIPELWRQTYNGIEFCSEGFDGQNQKFFMFTTPALLADLSAPGRKIFLDATFKVSIQYQGFS